MPINERQEIEKLLMGLSNSSSPNFEDIHKKLTVYEQYIENFSTKFNMISHNDLKKIKIRHIYDSLMHISILRDFQHDFSGGSSKIVSAIDVGSGAGFPGIVISIVQPEIKMTLLESNHKKAEFLNLVISDLKLENSVLVCDRAEALAHIHEHRESYDFAFERALAKPPIALEFLLPFVRIGGRALFWAGGAEWDDKKNIDNLCHILGGRLGAEEIYTLPGEENINRKIVVIEKIKSTDIKYPRRTGIPQKRPLGAS